LINISLLILCKILFIVAAGCSLQCLGHILRASACRMQVAFGGNRKYDASMNPTDLSNALFYGIPVVLYAGIYGGFDSLLARREPSSSQPESSLNGAEGRRTADPSDTNADLHIAIAKSPEQFESANDLVRERYAWRGYEVEGDAHLHAEARQERFYQEVTFLVASGQDTLGTLTLGLDGPHGLRAEASYGEVIDQFRAAGSRVCELTRLALAESTDSKAVLASLFSLAHAVGRTMHDVTDVFIEVNPRHVGFYSRVLGFAVAAGEKLCERARAPSVLLQLEIEALEKRLRLLDVAALMQPLAKAA